MNITKTEIYRFSIPMVPFTIATGTMEFAQNVFIRVYTKDGVYGCGECSAFPMIVGETQDTCLVLAKEFARMLQGKDASDIPARLQELDDYCARNTTIKSAFDMALFDVAAKTAGLPLYQFLGGKKKTVETDITIGIGKPGEMAAAAVEFKEKGASILKVKVGKKVQEDIERVKQIRKAVGEDLAIRLDANQGWSAEDALYALQGMAEFDIAFCEQPMRAYNDHLLPQLRKASPVRIMADESCYSYHDAVRLVRSEACDFINIKLAKTGGIREALRIQQFGLQQGIGCMMGGMLESRLALSAKLHLVYASEGIIFYDMDTCMLGHLVDPVTGGVRYDGYHLEIDDAPGIGADVDPDFLKSCEKIIID